MKILKTLSRLYVPDLNSALEFYEKLPATPAAMRFQISQIGLELAQIGNISIIAGSEEALEPFRNTKATFLVDSLDEFRPFLEEKGAEIILQPSSQLSWNRMNNYLKYSRKINEENLTSN